MSNDEIIRMWTLRLEQADAGYVADHMEQLNSATAKRIAAYLRDELNKKAIWDAYCESGERHRKETGWKPPEHCGACGGNFGEHAPYCASLTMQPQ